MQAAIRRRNTVDCPEHEKGHCMAPAIGIALPKSSGSSLGDSKMTCGMLRDRRYSIP
jgi:hypothetical protein